MQDDGKIVLAGFARTTNLDSVRAGLVRLTTSGAFDTSFDGDGVAQLGTAGLIASAIGIQSDGKIIAAGVANNRFAIERYATDGSLDRTFAGRAGVRFVPFVTPAGAVPSPNLPLSSEAFSLSVDAEDRIVVAGHAYTRIAGRDYHFGALARLAPAGDLDETFGDRGLIVTAVGTAPGNYAAFRSVSTRSNGSLVVAGEYETTTRAFKVALAQYDATGELQGQILDSFSPAGLVLRPHALVLSRAPTLVQVYATVVGNGSARIEGASGMRSGAGLMRYVLGAPLSIPSPPITPIQLPGRPAFPEQIR
jgi:uncharacterized delta-60 repeat protein